MIQVTRYILAENGATLCATCLDEVGVAYEMATMPGGYACDETETGHFLPGAAVPEYT